MPFISSLFANVYFFFCCGALSSNRTTEPTHNKFSTPPQNNNRNSREPTWFCFDGEPLSCPGAPTFSGSDAPAVLEALGYTEGEILGLQQARAVVPTNWHQWNDHDNHTDDVLFREGLE